MLRRSLLAFAALAVLGVGSDARAGQLFSYASTPVPAVTAEPTTTVTYTGIAGSGETDTDIAVGEIFLAPPSGDGAVASGPITWSVDITDTASGDLGTFALTSTLFGSVTATSSLLDFTWTGDPVSQVLGGFIYTVTAKFIDVPVVQTDGSTTPGSLTATVTATAIPEPSTIAMAGIGLLGLAGTALRRRRSS
jgi:hypothetical protein